jgi:hypothetical protein
MGSLSKPTFQRSIIPSGLHERCAIQTLLFQYVLEIAIQ